MAVYRIELLTLCFGVGLMVLSFLRLTDLMTVSPVFVTGLSLSGFFITLSDAIEMLASTMYEKEEEKQDSKFSKWIYWLAKQGIVLCYYAAMFCIIVLPHISIMNSINEKTMEKISDFSSFMALGFTVVMIALRNKLTVTNGIMARLSYKEEQLKQVYEEFAQQRTEFLTLQHEAQIAKHKLAEYEYMFENQQSFEEIASSKNETKDE